MNFSTFLIFLFFGFIPSIIWLLYFLRKDVHPESKEMILKIFFYGFLSALVAGYIEIFLLKEISGLNLSENLAFFLGNFFGIALIEESVKYLVVRMKVLSHTEFDEPTDAMLYMIISALGFAALENTLIFLNQKTFNIGEALVLSSFRFISATFLHALWSGLVGYFLAQSLYEVKKRTVLLSFGLFLSTALHGIYNFSIIMIKGEFSFLIPLIMLIAMALIVRAGFEKLAKMENVCKVK
jgi:RsiW-degrading membrane proteinase PrsW (M82 family)